jgi:hypothetical protein
MHPINSNRKEKEMEMTYAVHSGETGRERVYHGAKEPRRHEAGGCREANRAQEHARPNSERVLMSFGHESRIEDVRNHRADVVAKLKNLLASDVAVTPDPKRKCFYELEAGTTVYYIHVSPVTETIYFLATWEK